MVDLKGNKKKLNFENKMEKVINIGSCVKIKNSKKIFQVIGVNHKNTIYWLREWPLKNSNHQTFALSINNILVSTICNIDC